MNLPLSVSLAIEQTITVEEVSTRQHATTIFPLYSVYYKRVSLTEEAFLDRWQTAHQSTTYHMLATYLPHEDKPQGFIDFSIIPSIFWGPSLARIDSVYVHNQSLEKEISDALFDHALQIMGGYSISKVIAVSCSNYEQEVRILSRRLQVDNNPSKTFFMLMVDQKSQ
jgi:hypothetical protein